MQLNNNVLKQTAVSFVTNTIVALVVWCLILQTFTLLVISNKNLEEFCFPVASLIYTGKFHFTPSVTQ